MDFEELEIVGFLRTKLEDRFGIGAKTDSVLAATQTAAAIIVRGVKPGEKDRDLARAVDRLRGDGITGFEDAVAAIADVLAQDLIAGDLPQRKRTPHDLIKIAARRAGHSIGRGITAPESLETEDVTTSIWDLRHGDSEYRQGERLPVSDHMLVALRDALAVAAGIRVGSASRLATRTAKAAAILIRARIQGSDCSDAAKAIGTRIRIDDMAREIGAMADLAVERLMAPDDDGPDAWHAWQDLTDDEVTALALALPFAGKAAEIGDFLAMAREDRLLTLHALGTRCRSWLSLLKKSRRNLSSGAAPSLVHAMARVRDTKTAAMIVLRHARTFVHVQIPLFEIEEV